MSTHWRLTCVAQCPLSGVKQTCGGRTAMSANDPKRTFDSSFPVDLCQSVLRPMRALSRAKAHTYSFLAQGAFVMKLSRSALAGAGLLALSCVSALAQQVTGVPGSPGATTTIDGKQLPPPDPKFGGVIEEKASESKSWWAPRVVPPKGAPNVLLIMTDDVGFGAPVHVWRGDPDTGDGPYRRAGSALHRFPLHGALLTDAGGADHRPQSSLGGQRGGRRNSDGLSRVTTQSSRLTRAPSVQS